jgi:SAM-dependent methyltransferase
MHVLDVGCGRGGDINKIRLLAQEAHRSIDSYVGLDVAAAALQEAYSRLIEYERELRFDLYMCDAGSAKWDVPDGSQNLIMCHFTAHYWADTETRWRHFWSEASRSVARYGVMTIIVLDYSVIARLARDRSLNTYPSCVQVELESPTFFDKPLDELDAHGCQCLVTLTGTLDRTKETCVHPALLFGYAKEFGWNVRAHESMQSLVYRIGNHETVTKIDIPALEEDEWNALNLYRMYAFVKT